MDNEDNPEESKPEVEQLDFNRGDYTFTPKGAHDWKQRGYYIVCKSCDLEHALWVGAQKLLVGLDDAGQPILKYRHEIGLA